MATKIDVSDDFVINQPLMLVDWDSHISGFDGSRYGKTVWVSYEGPGIVVGPKNDADSLHPYPRTQGPELYIPADGSTWWDLRDSQGWDIHGLSELTIECVIKQESLSDSPGYILCSRGREFFLEEAIKSAFELYTSGNNIVCSLTTTEGRAIVSANGVTAGEYCYIRMEYTGEELRLYIAGELKSSTPLTGTVVQHQYESVYLGGRFNDMLGGMYQNWGFGGWLKYLTLSSYGKVLWNSQFNEVSDLCLGYQYKTSNDVTGWGWLLTRSQGYGMNKQSGCTVEYLDFKGNIAHTPIMTIGATNIRVNNIRCGGSRYGIYLSNNSYEADIRDVKLGGGAVGRAGLLFTGASGVSTAERVRLEGYNDCLIVTNASVTIDKAWILPKANGIWACCPPDPGIMLMLRDVSVSHENTTAQGVLKASSVGILNWDGGAIDTHNTPFRIASLVGEYEGRLNVRNLHIRTPKKYPLSVGAYVNPDKNFIMWKV